MSPERRRASDRKDTSDARTFSRSTQNQGYTSTALVRLERYIRPDHICFPYCICNRNPRGPGHTVSCVNNFPASQMCIPGSECTEPLDTWIAFANPASYRWCSTPLGLRSYTLRLDRALQQKKNCRSTLQLARWCKGPCPRVCTSLSRQTSFLFVAYCML